MGLLTGPSYEAVGYLIADTPGAFREKRGGWDEKNCSPESLWFKTRVIGRSAGFLPKKSTGTQGTSGAWACHHHPLYTKPSPADGTF